MKLVQTNAETDRGERGERVARIPQCELEHCWDLLSWAFLRVYAQYSMFLAPRGHGRALQRSDSSVTASQGRRTFLHNHTQGIWACDFLPVTDLLFRQLYAFVIVKLSSRKIMHVGVRRHPSDEWTVQQLRNATPFHTKPRPPGPSPLLL